MVRRLPVQTGVVEVTFRWSFDAVAATPALYVEGNAVSVATLGDGKLSANDGGKWRTGPAIRRNQWYRLRYRIDVAGGSYSAWLDGKLLIRDAAFRRPITSVTEISLHTHLKNTQEVRYDNIKVTSLDTAAPFVLDAWPGNGIVAPPGTPKFWVRLSDWPDEEIDWEATTVTLLGDDPVEGTSNHDGPTAVFEPAQPLPPGDYRMLVSAADRSGNRLDREVSEFKVDRPDRRLTVSITSQDATSKLAAREAASLLSISTGRAIHSSSSPSGLLILSLDETLELDGDAYRLKRTDHGLVVLASTPRGLMYGTYSLLEKLVGFGQFFPYADDVVVDKTTVSEVLTRIEKIEETTVRPVFVLRQNGGMTHDAPLGRTELVSCLREIEYLVRNGYETLLIEQTLNMGPDFVGQNWSFFREHIFPHAAQRGLRLGIWGHNWPAYISQDAPGYPRDHSWGVVIDGKREPLSTGRQFCTSNPHAREAFLSGVIRFWRENPELFVWGGWPNDCGGWCECDECSKFSPEYRALEIYNDVARRLEAEEADPESPLCGGDRLISFLLYANVILPPKEGPQAIQPHTKVLLALHPWGRDYEVDFADGPANDLYLKWREYLDPIETPTRITICTKYTRGLLLGHHLMPLPSLQKDMAYYAREGVNRLEMHCGLGGWWVKGLTAYVTGKLCWDPDTDVQALLDDFFARYYGDAAKQMQAFYQETEQAQTNPVTGSRNWRYGSENLTIWWNSDNTDWSGLRPEAKSVPKGAFEFLAESEARLTKATGLLNQAASRSTDAAVLSRIAKARASTEYALKQKRAYLKELEAGRALKAALAADDRQGRLERLEASAAAFTEARRMHEAYLDQGRQSPGLAWDSGIRWSDLSHIDKWLAIVDDLRNKSDDELNNLRNVPPWTVPLPK